MLLRQGHFPLDVSLRSISQSAFVDLIETSSAVFDFANHRQVGYTMRTIENLCAGKKIITNNPAIKSEEFYSDDRIHVFDGMDYRGIRNFLEKPLKSPDAAFREFHLSNFLKRITGDTSGDEPTTAQ